MKPGNAFTTIRDIRDGGLLDDLSEHLTLAVEATERLRKKSTVTITLELCPEKSAGVVTIVDSVKTKLPKDVTATLFFSTPENNLTRRNPKQRDIMDGLTAVDSDVGVVDAGDQPAETKEV